VRLLSTSNLLKNESDYTLIRLHILLYYNFFLKFTARRQKFCENFNNLFKVSRDASLLDLRKEAHPKLTSCNNFDICRLWK